MKCRITPLLRNLWLVGIFLTPLAMGESGPYPPKLSADGKFGMIGDSLALGIHASEMCGNDDAYECAQHALGAASPDWSYVAADKSWSIASRLGFDTAHIVAAYGGGEEWKDALDQAMTVMADPQVEAVFIGLGANNVCAPQGHDYSNDLAAIAGEIDATLTYLTDSLPAGGRIYWSGVLDVLQLYDLMRRRDHNYWFEACQGTWDLDPEKIKDGAANDVCDHFFDHTACQLTSSIEEAKDQLMKLLFNRWLDLEGVGEGPCGKILSSRSTDADRAEAREFAVTLNQLMSDKAVQYNGRNGVAVYYSNRIFEASANMRPYHVSRLDCFHPSRAGQMFLANETWRGFDPHTVPASRYFFDEFDSQDYCVQEYTTWDSCWTEIGESDGPSSGDIQINVHELRVQNRNTGILRRLNLDGMEAAWLQFNWRRDELDNKDDYVSIDVSPDAGMTWYQQNLVKGDGDDYNMHRGYYCDITPYATADTLLRFKSSSDLGDHDAVFFDNITVVGWGPAKNTFNDVPVSHWAYTFIVTLAASGITSGCDATHYCPNDPVTRAQMAVFLERGMRGNDYNPEAGIGNIFLDVPAGYWAGGWVEQLYMDGITAGCDSNKYCPGNSTTRAEMAVFLLRAKHGMDYTPPTPSGVFNDVPPTHWAAGWIEQLAAEGITSGCGNGNYCPNDSVTRAQMAVFLVKTFGL